MPSRFPFPCSHTAPSKEQQSNDFRNRDCFLPFPSPSILPRLKEVPVEEEKTGKRNSGSRRSNEFRLNFPSLGDPLLYFSPLLPRIHSIRGSIETSINDRFIILAFSMVGSLLINAKWFIRFNRFHAGGTLLIDIIIRVIRRCVK